MVNLTDALKFEIANAWQELRRIDNWIWFFSFLLIVIAYFRNYMLLIPGFILLFLLHLKRDTDSGRVIAHLREKERERINKIVGGQAQ